MPMDSGDDEIDCSDAIHTMYHFLDGEMTPERRQHIQHHLEECLPCFEAFDFEAELRQLIAHKCREQAPESLKHRVADALRMEAGIGGGSGTGPLGRRGPDPLGKRGIPNL